MLAKDLVSWPIVIGFLQFLWQMEFYHYRISLRRAVRRSIPDAGIMNLDSLLKSLVRFGS
jgi:hypothetical protein